MRFSDFDTMIQSDELFATEYHDWLSTLDWHEEEEYSAVAQR